ncbi:unnamed protein product [Tilletia controversa]|uniref:Uncharacterized protein n=3 Tax=Tilletia TaxID=13289 RepID=A0A8X7MMQ9_9BASI|nr:hypothetical protein CF336_g6501 [Tilletia laevis]KAE8198824.1 hypothetical protein CF328_g3433 [Tilletia controversa]KAE8253565.1 hypothetical protein A4X03_0g5861 [Tilletia caries]KAE8192246.1 hypothetical protein CF335_g5883 [Tilletia laevis]KAE8242364.1 hypothetical protein A4X06_0g6967 [Tilletia controversa]
MSNGRPSQPPIAQVYNPIEFQAEVNIASSAFEDLLSPTTEWKDYGEQDGVRIYRGDPPVLPGRDPSPGRSVLPLCKSEVEIEDAKPVELLSCVHQAAYRCLFDPRLRTSYYLRRFSMFHNQFYAVLSLGRECPTRELVGVQFARFFEEDGNEVAHPTMKLGRIDLVFASVDDVGAPPVEGKVRANYWHAGFRFTATERGTAVQYISQVDYGQPIPSFIHKVMWLEEPLTVGRLKETFRLLGFPPYVLDPTHTIVMQLQSFDVETRAVTISALVVRAGTFTVVLDSKRMYKEGVFVSDRSGPAIKSIGIEEMDGNIQIKTIESAVGHAFELMFRACDQEKDVDPDGSNEW